MLSDRELQILGLLRENSRATVTEISRKVCLPRSTVYEKIKKFRRDGIINKYSCLINFNRLGLPICAKILFKVNGDGKTKLADMLANSEHTNNVVKLGNEYDLMASFIFDSMDNLHKFLDKLTADCKIEDYRILYVTKDLKREGFL